MHGPLVAICRNGHFLFQHRIICCTCCDGGILHRSICPCYCCLVYLWNWEHHCILYGCYDIRLVYVCFCNNCWRLYHIITDKILIFPCRPLRSVHLSGYVWRLSKVWIFCFPYMAVNLFLFYSPPFGNRSIRRTFENCYVSEVFGPFPNLQYFHHFQDSILI